MVGEQKLRLAFGARYGLQAEITLPHR
jgi:hypothetical protein